MRLIYRFTRTKQSNRQTTRRRSVPIRLPVIVAALLILAGCARPDAIQPKNAPANESREAYAGEDAALRVMSFNIRYNNPNDGEDVWPNRIEMAAGMIRFHDADVAGLQEALKDQIDDLQERLPNYTWIGVGRADGEEAGEFSPIFFREDRLALLREDTFWLSETPEVPGSKSWDAAIERVATWAIFRDRATDEEFFVLNTHFDHIGEEARANSAGLIVERLDSLAGERPVVVMGDFNATDETAAYATLTSGVLQDAMLVSENPHHGPTSTWNGFEAVVPDRRIDYIFVNQGFRVIEHGILSDTFDGRYPSDHLPVLAEVAIRR